MSKLRWQRIIHEPQQAMHVKRTWLPAGQRTALHGHDFAEVFLIISGTGQHLFVDTNEDLRAGDGRLVAPECVHAMLGAEPEGMEYINFAFCHRCYRSMTRLYPELRGRAAFRFTPAQVKYLAALAQSAGTRQISPLQRDHFLLNFFREGLCGLDAGASDLSGCPEWLAAACCLMEQTENFSRGAGRLAELCGRSPEHVARELKRTAGLTPVELTTRLRMNHAAHLLRFTRQALLEVALDCGYSSFSHFHHTFRKYFSMTPLAYKKRNLVQP